MAEAVECVRFRLAAGKHNESIMVNSHIIIRVAMDSVHVKYMTLYHMHVTCMGI